MRHVLIYTAGRLGILAALLVLLWLLGLGGFPLILLALVLSMPVSYLALGRSRVAMGEQIAARVERGRAKRATLRARLRGETPPERP